MKILFLNIYQGSVNRGSETFIKEISERLRKKHEVDVIGAKKIPPARSNLQLLRRIYLDRNSMSVAWFTFKCIPLILFRRYDVVVPTNGGWQAALVRLTTWIYGGKMVISGQSGIGWDDRNNLWCFPNAFVALSEKARVWAQKINRRVRCVVIPNGVDTRKFNKRGKKLLVELEKPIVLCVAALTKTKRVDLTIHAVAKIKKTSLLVVGDGELKDEILTLGKKLLGKRFKLINLKYEKMPEVYRIADVFTLASEDYYSFEIVLTEAMASGLAVVANNDEIRSNIVGSAGILIDPTDTENYAGAIKRALDKKWGDKPRDQALKYDWNLITDGYETLFGQLLK